MEADFLASLHHTRKLEAELHDALTAALRVRSLLLFALKRAPCAFQTRGSRCGLSAYQTRRG